MSQENISKSEQERFARRRASRLRTGRTILIWAVIVGVIAGGAYWLVASSRRAEGQKPGVAYPIVGNNHINPGQKGAGYNSNPPTSGPHYPDPAKWGVHDQPLPDEQLLHNLEHGGIWISYQDEKDQQLVSALRDIAKDYAVKVIVTPRPEDDSKIAVAAWGRLLKLETFDRGQILDFIKAFINKGPEDVPY